MILKKRFSSTRCLKIDCRRSQLSFELVDATVVSMDVDCSGFVDCSLEWAWEASILDAYKRASWIDSMVPSHPNVVDDNQYEMRLSKIVGDALIIATTITGTANFNAEKDDVLCFWLLWLKLR